MNFGDYKDFGLLFWVFFFLSLYVYVYIILYGIFDVDNQQCFELRFYKVVFFNLLFVDIGQKDKIKRGNYFRINRNGQY